MNGDFLFPMSTYNLSVRPPTNFSIQICSLHIFLLKDTKKPGLIRYTKNEMQF